MSAVPQEQVQEDVIGDTFSMFNQYLDIFEMHPGSFNVEDVRTLIDLANRFADVASAAMVEFDKRVRLTNRQADQYGLLGIFMCNRFSNTK